MYVVVLNCQWRHKSRAVHLTVRVRNWKLRLRKEVRSYDILHHILKRLREYAWPETEAELA